MHFPGSLAEDLLSEEHLLTTPHSSTLGGSVPPAFSTQPKDFGFGTLYAQVRAHVQG